ncbi:MAG: fused MFS/spermidine synthase [Pseudomonadota bacterium]
MSQLDHQHWAAPARQPFAAAAGLPAFAFALFLSALLIFAVQPMFAKMVLPLLGGAPSVWNAAMVFFQASLLAGYLYAHLLARHVPERLQPIVHLGVMGLGALFLPFAVNQGFLPEPDAAVGPGVLVLFAVSIGFPFFALAANAPLLQSWFARTGHRDAHDPYFLYGASNAGSVLALLAYPVLIEPFFPMAAQTHTWAAGYGVLAISVFGAAWIGRSMLRSDATVSASPAAAASAPAGERTSVTWPLRLRWIAAAAIPSSLMLGVTTELTTNIAAAPFLWVLPLALYLITFILVFDRRAPRPGPVLTILHAALLIAVLMFGLVFADFVAASIAVHLALFFISALICHSDLASRRPSADRLTEFYLCMSAGGVIGGALTALFAPLLFPTIFEYPLMLAAACLFLPGTIGRLRDVAKDCGIGIGVFAAVGLLTYLGTLVRVDDPDNGIFLQAVFVVLCAAYLLWRARPVRAACLALAMAVASSLFVPTLIADPGLRLVSLERSFFGVTKVLAIDTPAGPVHQFVHGDTAHNAQLRDPGKSQIPLSYYATEGPFGDIIRAARRNRPGMRVANVGLGAGALACHARPGEEWIMYEIDPAVVRIATDPALFSYVPDCTPNAAIVLGDARLTMEREPDGHFDLIIVDAFSSASIPGHLVTVEAIELFRSKLKPDGLLFFHVSNRFADVGSVTLAAAQELGLGSRYIGFQVRKDMPHAEWKYATRAVAVAPEPILEAALGDNPDWQAARPNPIVAAWTDDWSNILGALIAKSRGGPVLERPGTAELADRTQ